MATHKTTRYIINVNRIPPGVAVSIVNRTRYTTLMSGVGPWSAVEGLLRGKYHLSSADLSAVKSLYDEEATKGGDNR